MSLKLREYQENGIVLVKNSLAKGNKRVVFGLATGGGKSLVAETIIAGAMNKGKHVMFVVNRVQLADQMSSHLNKARIEHGILQGANTRGEYHQVLIASIDTIYKRGWPEVDLIIIDECHSCAGNMKFQAMLEHYSTTPVVGVTATWMVRGLGKEYEWGKVFEDIVCPITIPELIEQKYLVDVDIYAPGEPDLTGVKVVAGDYQEKALAVACDKPKLIADIVETWQKLANGKKTIVFAVDIAHSKHIVEQFCKIGVTAEHIDYRMEYDEKKEIVRRFKAGEFTMLSNCALLSEGFDAPATECMILARPTKSIKCYIQMAGRILRPFEGKERAILLDHSGSTKELGFPTDIHPVELDDGKPKKTTGSDKEKKEALPKKCPSCSYLKPAKDHKCPICGFAPQKASDVEVVAGVLTKKEKAKEAKLAGLDKQAVFSELYQMAKERGYKPGWCANQYRGIFGVWPKGLKEVGRPPSLVVQNMVKAAIIRFHKGQKNVA